MSFIVVFSILVLAVMHRYGNGITLQPIFMFFTAIQAVSSAGLAFSLYHKSDLKRWQILLITLGLGCGVGMSAVAAFVMLELQHAGSF